MLLSVGTRTSFSLLSWGQNDGLFFCLGQSKFSCSIGHEQGTCQHGLCTSPTYILPGMGNALAGMQNTMRMYTYYALFLYAELRLQARSCAWMACWLAAPLCMLYDCFHSRGACSAQSCNALIAVCWPWPQLSWLPRYVIWPGHEDAICAVLLQYITSIAVAVMHTFLQ